jgi:hypothetical protein
MKQILVVFAALLLGACASIKKVESGANTLGERMSITVDGNWNHLDFSGLKPAHVWTMEGIAIDELLVYPGISDGQAMHPEFSANSKKKDFTFRKTMQTEEIVSMFEGVLSRDGSTFKLRKVEPFAFGGKKGFRFDYERVRKMDGVRLQGIGFGAVDKGELFALVYEAPRLTFFPRHQARVEAIAKAVTIK